MSSPIPIIADITEVRDLVQGITATEYPDEKVTKSLEYGSGEVCLLTNIFVWNITHKQFYRARTAANYFAASDLIPKSIADRDSGVPFYITLRKLGQEICNAINEGLPTDSEADNTSIIIKSTKNTNYYTNKNAGPYLATEGFGGAYNSWNKE